MFLTIDFSPFHKMGFQAVLAGFNAALLVAEP
jgi:hypothetical protein